MDLIRRPASCGVVPFVESVLVKGWFSTYWKEVGNVLIPVDTYGTKEEPFICDVHMYALLDEQKINISRVRYGQPLSFEYGGKQYAVIDGGIVYRACGFMSISEATQSLIKQFC